MDTGGGGSLWGGPLERGGERVGGEEMGAAWLGERNAIGGRGGKRPGRQVTMLQTTAERAIDITAMAISIHRDISEYEILQNTSLTPSN